MSKSVMNAACIAMVVFHVGEGRSLPSGIEDHINGSTASYHALESRSRPKRKRGSWGRRRTMACISSRGRTATGDEASGAELAGAE